MRQEVILANGRRQVQQLPVRRESTQWKDAQAALAFCLENMEAVDLNTVSPGIVEVGERSAENEVRSRTRYRAGITGSLTKNWLPWLSDDSRTMYVVSDAQAEHPGYTVDGLARLLLAKNMRFSVYSLPFWMEKDRLAVVMVMDFDDFKTRVGDMRCTVHYYVARRGVFPRWQRVNVAHKLVKSALGVYRNVQVLQMIGGGNDDVEF